MEDLASTFNDLIPDGALVTVHEVSKPFDLNDVEPHSRYFEVRKNIDGRMGFSAFNVRPHDTPLAMSRRLRFAYRNLQALESKHKKSNGH